jgi:manganese/zinc/iron transport system substrate-binding protein
MKLVLGLLVACGCLLSGCGRADGESGGPKKVVVTTTMIGDLVARIAGDKVKLTVIMGAGVDPHTYKPSPADMVNIGRADLVFFNGLHLEGTMVDLFEKEMKAKSVPVTRDIAHDKLLNPDGVHDPHVWFDVSLWAVAARTVGDELAKADPANADTYRANTAAVVADMDKLHEEVKSIIAAIPAERRVLITSHDAYSYFGRTYGVEVRGLQGISTEGEASISSISTAVDFIVSKKIPAVFVETSVPHKTIERVIADCRARGVNVKEGGELYSDAMGSKGERPGFAVETYRGMVLYNATTIANALK